MNKNKTGLKNLLFGKLSRKIIFLFLIVGIIVPSSVIFFFYIVSRNLLIPDLEIYAEQLALLETTFLIIIALIAIDMSLVGFIISRSISKPLKQLKEAAEELEKGNFKVRTDITTHDEFEQLSHAFNRSATALAKMEEERQQLDKAKSEFLSITSHELRTPITPLKAQLQMLQNEFFGKLTSKQKQSLHILLRNAERLNKIIEDFLEISRIEAARLKFVFKETNIEETINETVGLLEGMAKEKNITLQVNAKNLPQIRTDPDRISQVLRNLIHNAIKFSSPNSIITMNASHKYDHILFSVRDQGVGMCEDDQIRVFEPFFQIEETLNRKHGGTGLGLAICRGIVESQHGKIWVKSIKGKGCNFFFTIPLQPVEDIEPIKVLFSQKTEIEKKVQEAFTTTLGPMGIAEFKDLKNKNSINQKDIFRYIESIQQQNILDTIQSKEFKISIQEIFGTKNIPKQIQTTSNINFKNEVKPNI